MICTESCNVEGALRLIGGHTETVGRVEVCSGGVWGTVCDDLWDTPDAQVVCRQLGYSTIGGYTVMCFAKMQKYDRSTGVIARTAAYYGQGAGVTLLDDVQCGGTELKLTDCSHVTNKVCAHSKDAGVDCPGTKQTADNILEFLYNHYYIEYCTGESSIRLVNGTAISEGRVEICTNGVWSTVCDDFWGPLDAQVVCRQLGHVTDGMIT